MKLWPLLPALFCCLPLRAAEPVATTDIIISHGPPQRGPAVDEVMPGLMRCRDALPSRFSADLAVTGRLEAQDGSGRLKSLAVEKTSAAVAKAGLAKCVLSELSEAKLPLPAEGGISLRYLLHFRLAPPRGDAPPHAAQSKVGKEPAASPMPGPKYSRPRRGQGFPKPMKPGGWSAAKTKPEKKAEPKKPSQADEDAKAREAIRQAAVSALKLAVDGCFRRAGKGGPDRYVTLRFNVVLTRDGKAGFEDVIPGAATTAPAAVSDCAVNEAKAVTFRIAPELARVFPPEGLETSSPFTSP